MGSDAEVLISKPTIRVGLQKRSLFSGGFGRDVSQGGERCHTAFFGLLFVDHDFNELRFDEFAVVLEIDVGVDGLATRNTGRGFELDLVFVRGPGALGIIARGEKLILEEGDGIGSDFF